MNDSDKLLNQIEIVREKMCIVASTQGMNSLETIALSQELDRLLIIYENMKCNEKEKKILK